LMELDGEVFGQSGAMLQYAGKLAGLGKHQDDDARSD
jgi:hypothetical protein